MRPAITFALMLGLAAPAVAQDATPTPAPSPDPRGPAAESPSATEPVGAQAEIATEEYFEGRITVGGQAIDSETDSARRHEYRSLVEGVVVPYIHLEGRKSFDWSLTGVNVGQDDGQYRGNIETDDMSLAATWIRIPHNFGDNARVLVGEGIYPLAAANQAAIEQQHRANRAGVNFNFLNNLLRPQIDALPFVDIGLQRDRIRAEWAYSGLQDLDFRVTYLHEERNGDRGAGTSFGFSNVVETPEPIDYRTQDVAATVQYNQSWGSLRAGVRWNGFTNNQPVQTFGNPFRATDATDASAYSSPGSGSIGGAALGRQALPPDNQTLTGNVGFRWKLNDRNRLTGDLSYGRWTQDDAFIPFTTNSAITTPFVATDPSHLPAQSLDGKINVMTLNAAFNSRLTDELTLNVRVRRYDLDNQTPRIRFEEGYVRFDAVWEDIPRISVPYAYTIDRATASASYDFGPVTAEAGWKLESWDRTFREVETTTQNVFYGSLQARPHDRVTLRATAETGSRDFDGTYHTGEAEHASFLDAGDTTNQAGLRRYDLAKRDLTRLLAQVELNPVDQLMLTFGYLSGKEDYDESASGLLESENSSWSAQADLTPHERFTAFAWYTTEDISTFQRGRQSGGTASVNPADDWTADVQIDSNSFGAGAVARLIPGKLDLRVDGSYQKVDGNNDLTAFPGGAPFNAARQAAGGAVDIAFYDDTKITTFGAELAYTLRKGWTVGVGGWLEDFELEDAATRDPRIPPEAIGGQFPNFTPGGYFLAGDDGNFNEKAFYGRLSYAW